MSMRERINNTQNYNQCFNKYKRVLCMCSGGLLRSPTTAWVLSNPPFNFNTRSAGLDEHHALIIVDEVLVEWADEYVVMNSHQERQLLLRYDIKNAYPDRHIVVLNIPDRYQYREDELVELITNRYPDALAIARKEKSEPVFEQPITVDVGDGKGPPIEDIVNQPEFDSLF